MTRIKILYAEDEVFLGKIVKESLEARGFEVIMETGGSNVAAVFHQVLPDICVLDIMMPGKDGFAVAEEIRAFNKNVPIIFLTAKLQTEDVVKGFTVGANDYIRKPFSMEELIVRIHNLLRHQMVVEAPVGDKIMLGKYTFHVKRQTLSVNEEERKLSFRENELLVFLYRNRNAIIDRRELLNTLWGNDSFFNSRNLDVYITRLRSYLKADTSLEIITIKGIGYRFVII